MRWNLSLPDFLGLEVLWMKKAALGIFPFSWVQRFFLSKKVQLTVLEKSSKRGCLFKNGQQKRASFLGTLCWGWGCLSPMLKPVLQQVSCVNTNLWLENCTLKSSTFGGYLVFDVLFYETRDCPLKATINSLSS